ncbi:MAG: hypothetical protein ABJL67_22735 [Sulfitobacter sp.]
MKALLGLVLACGAAWPASAWEFTPGTPCVLKHETEQIALELTYDPTAPLYSISVTQGVPFDPAPIFSMRLRGRAPLTISTDQHKLSNSGKTLTVIDRGFGNVLNGLQFGQGVVIQLGQTQIDLPLVGASAPVASFRTCDVLPTA